MTIPTRYELVTHPRWPLYKKLRREIERQLEDEFCVSGIDSPVASDDVDIYIQANLGSITRKLKELFHLDLKTRAKAPEKVA